MTVKELHDRLETYMRSGIGDGWQLNDVELDKEIYNELCNTPVLVVDDGMRAKFIDVEFACNTKASVKKEDGTYEPHNVFGLVVDVTKKTTYE